MVKIFIMNSVLEDIREFEVNLDSVVDNVALREIRGQLADLLDRLDDRLDLQLIDDRRDEPTISHIQLTQELRTDGLI